MWTKTYEEGTLKIWSPARSLDEAPEIVQGFNPNKNGAAWATEAEAMEWAAALIDSIENPPVIEDPVIEDPALAGEHAPAEEAPADPGPTPQEEPSA